MFISFIVPVYNTEKYLNACLDLLFAQDISLDVCINDGATDRSKDILKGYESEYKN